MTLKYRATVYFYTLLVFGACSAPAALSQQSASKQVVQPAGSRNA
jgi:hypothetical protein